MCLFLRLNHLPEACCNEGTYEGTYDENPEVGQSVATCEDSGADGTGGVNARAGEVDAYQMDENQRETDGQTCEVVGSAICLVCRAKHYQHEEGCEDNLGSESHAPASVAANTDAVCTKSRTGIEIEQGSTGDDGADNLSAHVAEAVLHADTTCHEATQRDGRIDVATGDTSDGVGHSNYCKTEGDGCPDYRSSISSTTQANGCTATEECQYERTEAFSNVLFHK